MEDSLQTRHSSGSLTEPEGGDSTDVPKSLEFYQLNTSLTKTLILTITLGLPTSYEFRIGVLEIPSLLRWQNGVIRKPRIRQHAASDEYHANDSVVSY